MSQQCRCHHLLAAPSYFSVSVCRLLNDQGKVVAWDWDSMHVHDRSFHHVIEQVNGQSVALADYGFRSVEGIPDNCEPCAKDTWNERMCVKAALAMITVVCDLSETVSRVITPRSIRGLAYPELTLNVCSEGTSHDINSELAAAETIATSMPALTRRIDQEVRSGQLAYLLGRPCSYIFYNFAQYMGERLVRFTINGIVAAVVALVFVGPPHLTWMGVIAWPLVTFLALCIEFVAYFSIGLLAFWTEDTNSFSFVFSRLTLVLGGVLAPLEIFPQPLRSIAQALPFSAILYGPARTLVHFELYPFLGLLEQQLITVAVGCVILFAIYSVAIRRVSINGG